jgi:hypothetical protein
MELHKGEENMKQMPASRRIGTLIWCCVMAVAFLGGGCDSLRFAPSEQQKQNAWLHNRTAMAAADMAKAEDASQKLQSLAELSELQSRAFPAHFGLPKELPPADTVERILADSNRRLATTALTQSSERPDPWDVADSMLDLGIGICAVFGGVCGTKAVGFIKQARDKSKALQEIIAGNELFKQNNTEAATAFKDAHRDQSPQTRQIVTATKG